MTYVVYECQTCKVEVSAPANPEQTLTANGMTEERTVHCPKCKTPTVLELACRIKNGEKKRGRRKKSAAPLVDPSKDQGSSSTSQ